MAVSLSTISIRVVLMLNAGSDYSATVTDARWTTQEIVDAVLSADALVVAASISDVNNPYASGYYTTISGIAHGAAIGASSGPIISVQFAVTSGDSPSVRQAVLQDPAEISAEIFYPNMKYDAHFNTDGRILYHNGAAIASYETATVSVNVSTVSFTKTSSCQAADALDWLVFFGAMAQLVAVDGENVGAQSYWGQMFNQGLEALRRGQTQMPPGIDESAMQLAA